MEKFIAALLTFLIVALGFIIIKGISWIITCGIIKLITLCFGLNFSWGIATGIWLVILILKSIFKVNVSSK